MFLDVASLPIKAGEHCAVLDLRQKRPICTFFEKREDGTGRLQLARHYAKEPIAIFNDDYLVVIKEDGETVYGLNDYLPYITRDTPEEDQEMSDNSD